MTGTPQLFEVYKFMRPVKVCAHWIGKWYTVGTLYVTNTMGTKSTLIQIITVFTYLINEFIFVFN